METGHDETILRNNITNHFDSYYVTQAFSLVEFSYYDQRHLEGASESEEVSRQQAVVDCRSVDQLIGHFFDWTDKLQV